MQFSPHLARLKRYIGRFVCYTRLHFQVHDFFFTFEVPTMLRGCFVLWILILAIRVQAADPPKPELPRILLLGDSIRLGYAPEVKKILANKAEVISFAPNGGDTANMLKNLESWLEKAKPSIVQINCGLHDLKLDQKTKQYQVPLDAYASNLEKIITTIQKVTSNILFASTTPIEDARHSSRKANFDRLEADVLKYNVTALQVMNRLNIPVNDLHRIVIDGGMETMLGKDGTHYTPAGYRRLAEAVSDSLQRQLLILKPPMLKEPASGLEAVKAYQAAEADQDALVPERFKKLKAPEFVPPTTAKEWESRRAEIKAKVISTLGDLPARPKQPKVHLVSSERRPGFRLDRLQIDNEVDGIMSALLLIPDGLTKPAPAIFWLHSSSYDHTQLLTPNKNGGEEPLGMTFVKQGYVVFAPDAAWYGDRAGAGPSGASETAVNQHNTLHKYHLWFGRTLWGMFLRDDQIALDYLCTRPEVDIKRIGATGISMGSTRSWWLGAIDDRVAAVVGVACLTRYENLIKHGQLRQHGVYYFVFGLLNHFDIEAVLALMAPKPYLALTGELDAGSPADGIKIIEEKLKPVYQTLGKPEAFRSIRYPDIGHTYTPAMRAEMLAWFKTWLKPGE
jgi:lysophospholipase L1-like esterase/dienelactone hydrolase